MIEVAGISVRAGNFLLDDISLTAHQASCHAILGPTGSGKTVLLETVIGLRNPFKGAILLDGKEVTGCPTERRGLSYVPQDLALFPHMTVRENILYPLRIRGVKQRSENGIVGELMDSLDIRHVLDRSVRNLSGGERQRTALARAVASGCKNLVLDEPLSSLHESLKKELWYLLKELQNRYDLALLMVTHDLNEAFFLGDTISIIIDGRLHQQGNKASVYRHPESVVVAKFLGITNLFPAKCEGLSTASPSVLCEKLGVTLRLSTVTDREAGTGALSFVAGIRAEDIVVLIPGESPPSTTNAIAGTIRDVFEYGNAFTIIAVCGPAFIPVEATVPRTMYGKSPPSKGQAVLLRLPEENLFLIPRIPCGMDGG